MNSDEILKRHLLLSLQMLENLIKSCPEELWYGSNENHTIWKRVFHVLESTDYWFDDFEEYVFPVMFPQYTAEMDQTNRSPQPKNSLTNYSNFIKSKIENYCTNLTAPILTQHSIKHPKVTYLDIILSQIRHIQINIGYCNEKLSCNGFNGSDWTGYKEE